MQFERLTASHVAGLGTDFGGQFKSDEFRSQLRQHGIAEKPTVPHYSEINAVADRANRWIVTIICTCACLYQRPKALWTYAMEHTTRPLDTSIPDISIYWLQAYHRRPHIVNKHILDTRIFLFFSLSHHTNACICLYRGRIYYPISVHTTCQACCIRYFGRHMIQPSRMQQSYR